MEFLRKPLGRFPLGLWAALFFLVVSGLGLTIFAQGLSFFHYQGALSIGLQEDLPNSPDLVERAMAAVSWGEAGADIIIQGALIILALIGIIRKRWWGLSAGLAQAIIWIYVTLMVPLQRIGLYLFNAEPDLERFQYVWPLMAAMSGLPGLLMLICLVANRRYFEQ